MSSGRSRGPNDSYSLEAGMKEMMSVQDFSLGTPTSTEQRTLGTYEVMIRPNLDRPLPRCRIVD